jgi:hypothetical protein
MAILPEKTDVWKDIQPEEVRSYIRDYNWTSDSPALRLVVQDADSAEKYLQSKQYVLGLSYSDALYQSPVTPRYWPGTQTEAASITTHVVSTVSNSIVDQAVTGLFYDSPPFQAQPRYGTTTQQMRAVTGLIGYQLEEIDFTESMHFGCMNAILYGTEVFQYGWEKYSKSRKIVKLKNPDIVIPSAIPGTLPETRLTDDELEVEEVEEVVDRPTFEHIINLREIMVDPSLAVPDIRKAKFVIRRKYLTFQQLDDLRETEGYDIPSREKLLDLFLPPKEPVETAVAELGSRNPIWDAKAQPRWEDVTADPTQQPLEVLERWDNNTHIVVVQKKLVIHNDKNIYGKIPFLSVNWQDIPGAFWGLGIGRTTGPWQRLIEGMLNLLLDQAALNLQVPLVRVRGKSVLTQNVRIRPGAVYEVDAQGDISPMQRSAAVPEAQLLIAMAQQWISSASGNSPLSQGVAGEAGHSNMARSSAGAQGLLAGAAAQVSAFVDKVSRQVFVPFLYELYEMNRAMLSANQLQFILDKELQSDYLASGQSLVDLLNSRVKFSVLAGAKMQTRRNAVQGLPLVTQFLQSPEIVQQLAIEGKKVDVLEIIRRWFEAMDMKGINDVIVPMTDQDRQRAQQMSQGGLQQQKFQNQTQLQAQKALQSQQLSDSENIARAARDVIREGFKASVAPEILEGEPDATRGLGSLTT